MSSEQERTLPKWLPSRGYVLATLILAGTLTALTIAVRTLRFGHDAISFKFKVGPVVGVLGVVDYFAYSLVTSAFVVFSIWLFRSGPNDQ